jgi:hypothetical protein
VPTAEAVADRVVGGSGAGADPANSESGAHRSWAHRPGCPLGMDSMRSPGAISVEHTPQVVAYFAVIATGSAYGRRRPAQRSTALAIVVERVIQSRSSRAPSNEFS